MADKAGMEYLMGLIDEAERLISSDPLGEDGGVFAYRFRDEPGKAASSDIHRFASSCHACDGYLSRTVFPRPILRKKPRVMFIMPKPDGNMLLEGGRIAAFRKWWHDSLLLQEGEWALTSIIKCPVQSFDPSFADSCRGYLREEMAETEPSFLIILGLDAARYMLRTDAPMVDLMKKVFHINHIPSFVTPSLEEYAADPSLRIPIWENFLFIRDFLSPGKDTL